MAYSTTQQTIPSYLYQEYADDQDLQAFVASYNSLAQEYVNWFNQIGLPIYTGYLIAGLLLDWVAAGLYGQIRPSLQIGNYRTTGPFNTYAFNGNGYNRQGRTGKVSSYVVSDDIFKRILTWNYYKGDGNVFDIRWLKRRIMRFLLGTNGTAPDIDQTYDVSITFGVGNQANIVLISGSATSLKKTTYNDFAFNTRAFNENVSSFNPTPPYPLAPALKAAILAGVLQLPFQYTWTVSI